MNADLASSAPLLLLRQHWRKYSAILCHVPLNCTTNVTVFVLPIWCSGNKVICDKCTHILFFFYSLTFVVSRFNAVPSTGECCFFCCCCCLLMVFLRLNHRWFVAVLFIGWSRRGRKNKEKPTIAVEPHGKWPETTTTSWREKEAPFVLSFTFHFVSQAFPLSEALLVYFKGHSYNALFIGYTFWGLYNPFIRTAIHAILPRIQ